MTIGLMPYPVAQQYGIKVSRKVVYASSWLGWFASPYRDTILLNINNSSSGSFSTNPDTFARKTTSIINTLKPAVAVIENEELLNNRDIKIYCNQLTAASKVAEVTNGGLTLPELSFWYWYNTRDGLFFENNIPDHRKAGLLAGLEAQTIERVTYEVNVLKGLKMPFVNVHYYLGYDYQVQGLIQMFKYLSQFTGKPVICNEAGVYRSGLLKSVVQVSRETNMQYLILYSGLGTEGSGKALPISKADFENAIL